MKKGFSLIELLVVIAIIGILSVIVFPYYQSARKQFALQRSANKLAQDIRRAQGMALGAEEIGGQVPEGGYGIYLKTVPAAVPQTSYILFEDENNDKKYNDDGEKIGDAVSFEEGIKTLSVPTNHLHIIFKPPDPEVYLADNNGNDLGLDEAVIVISLTDESKTKTIKVNKAGLIYVE